MSRTRHHGDKKKEQLFGDAWKWMHSAPKWFSKMTKHKPQRAATRKAITDTMRDKEATWPHDKKPIEYYW